MDYALTEYYNSLNYPEVAIDGYHNGTRNLNTGYNGRSQYEKDYSNIDYVNGSRHNGVPK